MKKNLLFLFLLCCSMMLGGRAWAQQRTITGIISDEQGNPLPGVSVVIPGTSTGVSTDAQGKYSIRVTGNEATLSASFLGYETLEAVVGSRQTIDFTLKESSTDLDEVVVVGYGTVRKRDLTGSVVSVKAKDITALPSANALENLQGKVAGMDLLKNSGETGAGLSFTIRGNRSLNASNAPLVLVDGIPYGSNIDINPNSIASIEVLKDASSTAIYGSRGANGVILITTKKGAEGKTKISYSGYYSVNKVAEFPEIMDLQQWANFRREAYRTTGQWNGPEDDVNIFSGGYEYVKNNEYVDWVDMLIKDGMQTAHSFNMSSGNEWTKFNVSFEYMNEEGLFKKDDLTRYNATMSLDHKIRNNLTFSMSVIFTHTNNNKRRDPLNQAIKQPPYGKVYLEDGSINPLPYDDGQTVSPLADEIPGAYKNNTKTNRFLGSGSLQWEIIKGLTAKTTFGLDAKSSRHGHYADTYTIDAGGSYSLANATNNHANNWTWENTLNYDFTIARHNFQVLAGNAVYENVGEEYYGAGKDIISSSMKFYNLGGAQREQQISSDYKKTTMLSYFGRINYKFDERYLLTATFRQDGSSVLAKGKKWGFFPSVAAAWRINEEQFMRNADFLTNLKLRVSYGISGNSAVSPYQTEGGLGQTMYAFDVNGTETPAYGYYPCVIPNKNLTWEKTATTNFGLDFGFLNGRINGTFDYYVQNTKDLLMQKQIPATNGYTVAWDNVGKTRNRGFEIALNSLNVNTKNVTWNTDITFTRNKEKIVSLADGAERDIANGWFVGQPTSVHYAMEKIGIWQLGEEEEAAKYGQKPGQIKIKDQDDGGTIDNDTDRVILGTPRPKFVMGMNNTVRYKDFDLRVFMYWRHGQMIRSEAHGSGYRIQGDRGAVLDYWTPENPTNAYPRPDKSMSTGDITLGSLGYKNASFFKIRDITLGYTLPPSVLNKINIENIRFYCTLKNFFTISHMGKYDPERGGSLSYPMTKQVVFGLNIDF